MHNADKCFSELLVDRGLTGGWLTFWNYKTNSAVGKEQLLDYQLSTACLACERQGEHNVDECFSELSTDRGLTEG